MFANMFDEWKAMSLELGLFGLLTSLLLWDSWSIGVRYLETCSIFAIGANMLSGRAREKCWMRVLLETYSNIDFLMEDLSSLAEGPSLSLV